MAKKKQKEKVKCIECKYSFEVGEDLYCELSLQSKSILKDSGKVSKEKSNCDIGRAKIS